MSASGRKLLLVGWDAADWKVARPLMNRGEMPNLARLVARGASGNLATIDPPLSPMLWTSIATGKRPPKHGILGFSEPLPDGSGVRPVTTLGRSCKAVWNILNQSGLRPVVVGWWPSHPAEPVNGVMVTNHFHRAGDGPEPVPMLPGAVHPPGWAERLAELRVTPMDLPGEAIRLFVPEYEKVDQSKDKRLHMLTKVIAETLTVHAAATEVLEHADWDFAAVYYDAIDHFCHGFMRYHPPRLPWVEDRDFDVYQHVIANAYRYHDAMLGRLVGLAGPDATVMVISDHGFHPDALRPGYIPAEAAGPAVEHRQFGIVCLSGPGVKRGETVYGASVLDVTPTLLHLSGLPVGRDMDGKVMITALERPEAAEAIDSWDVVPGDAGTHPPGVRLDPVASAEAMKQLVALGYVAPPGDDARRAVSEAVSELRYNLARAHDDARRPDLSAPLYETLLAGDPDDLRFAGRLVSALVESGDRGRARAVLDAFDNRCQTAAPAAEAELNRRRQEKPDDELRPQTADGDARESYERRMLAERATGFVLPRGVLRVRLDLSGERFDEARRGLAELEGLDEFRGWVSPLLLARFYTRLGDEARALDWIGGALKRDPDDWQAMALAARLHLRGRRHAHALDAAAGSLALMYFQPITHFVMGRALAARGDTDGAERALRVAVSQMPGLVPAHEALSRLYGRQTGRSADAAHHRNRAAELRLRARGRRGGRSGLATSTGLVPYTMPARDGSPPGDPEREVVVVAGLPRSGTSMMMQMLAAGGVPPMTDSVRAADEDNPRGYFEFEPATRLGRDASWLPSARGKAVKLALPLVTRLPGGESYRLIVVERDPLEVIASQRAMLARLGRASEGASLDDAELAAEFSRQRERLCRWLEGRPEVAVLPLRYDTILADPRGTARRLGAFLGRPFHVEPSASAVDPALRRQSRAAPSPDRRRDPSAP